MFSTDFAKAAIERATRTFAQSLVAFLTVGGFASVQGIPWMEALGAALLAALLSLLMSVAATESGGDSGPSWRGLERLGTEERGDG